MIDNKDIELNKGMGMKIKTIYSDYEQYVIDGNMVNWYLMKDNDNKLVVEGTVGDIKDYVHLMYHTYDTKVIIKGKVEV